MAPVEVLKPKVPVRRMVFHEITKEAILRALEETREIDRDLVDAQETRRILDRLYGYEVSPVLWKKVTRGLSAGRVQSVATRLVVERERERMRFVAAALLGRPRHASTRGSFEARLAAVDGRAGGAGPRLRPATGSPADAVVVARRGSARGRSPSGSRAPVRSARGRREAVHAAARARRSRTSTLQQEAGRKLRFSAQTTMRVAQRLYENGYITYMRTDSAALSETAVAAARAQAAEVYGAETVPGAAAIATRAR